WSMLLESLGELRRLDPGQREEFISLGKEPQVRALSSQPGIPVAGRPPEADYPRAPWRRACGPGWEGTETYGVEQIHAHAIGGCLGHGRRRPSGPRAAEHALDYLHMRRQVGDVGDCDRGGDSLRRRLLRVDGVDTKRAVCAVDVARADEFTQVPGDLVPRSLL